MLNLNSDGLSSPYSSQQLNPWFNLNTLQAPVALQPWQQAAQQMALQQLLAQQLAMQSMQPQTFGGAQTRGIGVPSNQSIGLPSNPGPLALAVQQIAQSLYVLAQQLTQIAAQSSIPGIFGHPYANQLITNPAYGNQHFTAPLGQQFPSGLALH